MSENSSFLSTYAEQAIDLAKAAFKALFGAEGDVLSFEACTPYKDLWEVGIEAKLKDSSGFCRTIRRVFVVSTDRKKVIRMSDNKRTSDTDREEELVSAPQERTKVIPPASPPPVPLHSERWVRFMNAISGAHEFELRYYDAKREVEKRKHLNDDIRAWFPEAYYKD